MTIIITDGKEMVADKMSWGTTINTTTKVFKINGMMVGFAGRQLNIESAKKWAEDGFIPDAMPESQKDREQSCSIMAVNQEGEILVYENGPYPWKSESGLHATGTGAELALGAVFAGATLATAVCIAIHRGGMCGRGIDRITLENDTVETKLFEQPTFE